MLLALPTQTLTGSLTILSQVLAVLLTGSSGGSFGSSGGSLVATPDCETAVLGSNPAISPAYSRLPVLRWAAIWDGTLL
jgi:hypothetical protein